MGYFRFGEATQDNPSGSVELKSGTILRILTGTEIDYVGNGNSPGFILDGINSTLIGSGEGISSIRSGIPMKEGLIQLNSQDLIDSPIDNSFNAVIRHLNLVSTAPTQLNPRDNRGLVLFNTPESGFYESIGGVFKGSFIDLGSNYYANVSDIDLSGFDVGMHLEGQSNGNNIRNIVLTAIDAVGVWISGCVDNSLAYIDISNSPNATGIRYDNYVFSVHDPTGEDKIQMYDNQNYTVGVSDPNCRYAITANDILQVILQEEFNGQYNPNGNDQEKFNWALDGLHPYLYGILSHRCAMENVVIDENGPNEELTRLGLRGLSQASNYQNFDHDISLEDFVFDSSVDEVNGQEFNIYIPSRDNNINTVNYLDATCEVEPVYSRYFASPTNNSFSYVNVYDGNGALQVSSAVEIYDRSDASDSSTIICEHNVSGGPFSPNCTPSSDCDPNTSCYYGFFNKIRLCKPENLTVNIGSLFSNMANQACGNIDVSSSSILVNDTATQPPNLLITFH